MDTDCKQLQQLGAFDFDSINSFIAELKSELYRRTKTQYAVLVFDNVYCFIKHEYIKKLTRYDLIKLSEFSDLIIKFSIGSVEIIKSKCSDWIDINKFAVSCGVNLRNRYISYNIDEE